jgi:CheY-like chemotaxis protein
MFEKPPERAPAVPVLVVDDNCGFLRVVRAVLESGEPSFAVQTVETGHDALALLDRVAPFEEAPRPAFIVLDYHLHDLEAPAVLALMSARPGLEAIPVLVLSVAGWEKDQAAAMAAGAVRFHEKPSRVGPLRDLLVTFWKEHVDGGQSPSHRG